jgi:dipeptidyl aminopeptidase/acylaminoacyl peptidase
MKSQLSLNHPLQVTFLLTLLFGVPDSLLGEGRSGNLLNELPRNIRQLTHFGERAAWSPDGRRIAFVHKTLGDAFEIDLDTERIHCLTCSFTHAGFFRVQYLPTGDFILIGPLEATDKEKARWDISEIWFLAKDTATPARRLNQRLSEGIAISREDLLVSWVVSARQYPGQVEEGITELWVARIEIEGDDPVLRERRKVYEDEWPHCWLEAQDFRKQDDELLFSCYQPENNAEVMGVNLHSGEVTNYTNSPGVYDEPEGVFPDGEYTLVESDLQNDKGDHFIDIWKLKLDGTGKDYSRLTYFSDYEGYKASNPVVSPDGTMMAFQIARSKDAPGVGYGILLYRFRELRPR